MPDAEKAEEVLNDAIEYGIWKRALEETRRWMKLEGAARTDNRVLERFQRR